MKSFSRFISQGMDADTQKPDRIMAEMVSQEEIREKKKAIRRAAKQKRMESWDAMRSRINESKGGK